MKYMVKLLYDFNDSCNLLWLYNRGGDKMDNNFIVQYVGINKEISDNRDRRNTLCQK